MTVKMAFEMGWSDAKLGKRHQTYRQVTAAYPSLTDEQVSAYQNGWEDGMAGDRFRIDMPERAKHCTHLDQAWCDCDWCRVIAQAAK